MKRVLIEPHYLPSLEYFCAVLPFDEILLEKHEHFVKQTNRNRCYLNTSQGVVMLTVPLAGKHSKANLKDIRIDHSKKWQNNHWRTIESAYRKAPFFEYYEQPLQQILFKQHEFLFEMNCELLSFCLQNLNLPHHIAETLTYEKTAAEDVIDLRSLIACKKTFSNSVYYQAIPYYQVFGNTFVPNLSVIDLLFCEGPNSKSLLLRSMGNTNK